MQSRLTRFEELRKSCTRTEKKIVDYLLAFPNDSLHHTIYDLARHSNSSTSAIIRLCKRAGCCGYREFQLLLAEDFFQSTKLENSDWPFIIKKGRSVEEIAQLVAGKSKNIIQSALLYIRPEDIEEIANYILEARSVYIFASADSSTAGYDCLHKFTRIGITCSLVSDPYLQSVTAQSLAAGTVVLFFADNSWTEANQFAATELKKRGSFCVAISGTDNHPLEELADRFLLVPCANTIGDMEASFVRNCQLLLVDILYTTIICRSLDTSLPRIARSMLASRSR